MKQGNGLRNTGGLRPNFYGIQIRGKIKQVGRVGEARKERREQWIEDYPPKVSASGRKYYMCHICVYFGEWPEVALVWFENFVLEHIEAKGHMTFEESQADKNLGPAHWDCNLEKGSQELWQMEKSPKSGLPNPHKDESP